VQRDDSTDPVRAGYAGWAGTYDTHDNPMIAMTEVAMRDGLPPLAGSRVVELGCGTGRNLQRFLQAGAAALWGLDVSPEMLARARQRLPATVQLLEHDLRDPLPLPEAMADVVLFSLVLEHLPQLTPVLREVARVLRPGGLALAHELHPTLVRQGVGAHFTTADGRCHRLPSFGHDEAEFRAAARAAGLAVRHVRSWIPDERVFALSAKARRYAGRPMLLSVELVAAA
jgi:SAM-dependent methyltransferase